MKIKLPKKKYNPILYGHNGEENIVAVEHVGDGLWEVYKRVNGELDYYTEHVPLWFLTTSNEPLLDDVWEDTEVFELEGDMHFDRLVETNNPKFPYWFRRNVERSENFYMANGGMPGMYLTETGKTMLKGMDYDDPLRAYFDLEVLTTPGYKFPNNRPGDKICFCPIYVPNLQEVHNLILADDDYDLDVDNLKQEMGEGHYFYLCSSEKKLVNQFCRLIRSIDPDILVNHNIFNFDLDYLWRRSQLLNLDLELGRDESIPRTFPSTVYIADKKRQIQNFKIYGRHILDTEIMARQADSVARKYPGYGLKTLIKYLGLERKGRTHLDTSKLNEHWKNRREDVIKYGVDDVYDARLLDLRFGSAAFHSTKFTPMALQDVSQRAPGSKSESLFVRYYKSKDHGLAKPEPKRKYGGGYADALRYGLTTDPSILVDISSLYPSLAIREHIQPKSEPLGYFQKVINLMTDFRLDIKSQIKSATGDEAARIKSFDGSIKEYLNSIAYGVLGSATFVFNDMDEAERITTEGQKVLKSIINHIKKLGGTPIKADTDGAVIVPPDEYRESESELVAELNRHVPKGIKLGIDAEIDAVLTVDGKSYAMLMRNGEIVIKGDTLKSRGHENFINKFLYETIETILKEDSPAKVEKIFNRWRKIIERRLLTSGDVVQSEELKISLEDYKNQVTKGPGKGGRNRSAGYEIALRSNGEQEYQIGDKIAFFITEPAPVYTFNEKTGQLKSKKGPQQKFKLAKPIDEYDPDEIWVEHYLSRLRSAALPVYRVYFTVDEMWDKFGIKMDKNQRDKYYNDIQPKLHLNREPENQTLPWQE